MKGRQEGRPRGDSAGISLPCRRCGADAVPRVARSGPHLRADCGRCGGYIAFVPRTPSWLAMVAAPTQGVLFDGMAQ